MAGSRRLALALAGVVAVVALGRAEVAEPLRVNSDSMTPTLQRGDHVLIEKIRPVRRGDLVAFTSPQDRVLTVKRVVGRAGDRVELRDGALYVNDERIAEPTIDPVRIDGTYLGPVTVPPGQFFVLGDNRANSVDSRSFGPVAAEAVTGRVLRPADPGWR